MNKEQQIIFDQEIEKYRGQFVLLKVVGDRERMAIPWPPSYKIPRNSAIGIGVPQQETAPIVIAFAQFGRQHAHAYLETATTSGRQIRGFVRAYLKSNKGNCILEIPRLSEKDRQLAEKLGHPADPMSIFTDRALTITMAVLRVNKYRYIEDTRNSFLIEKARERIAQEVPTCGLIHLVWEFKKPIRRLIH
ncbi:MAG: hypothetical protein V1858_03445 [Candidatus Gottesmanbacteria bacterium]